MVINLIKYPNNIVKTTNKKIKNYGNRGMTLESEISSTNEYYLLHDNFPILSLYSYYFHIGCTQ